MTAEDPVPASCLPALPRRLPVLLFLFFGSGCAALIYEVVWFQLLQLVIGSSAVSLGVLLATFMGGMCLGSVLLPRLVSGRRHPLRVYACLELGIGVLGVLVLFGMPWIGGLYTAHFTGGFRGIMLRGAVCAACLLPPTLLMGATLPAIARWVESTPRGIAWLGFFYAGNTVGAVAGCLLAGFYLLRVYDLATATYCAVAINALVGVGGLVLAHGAAYRPPLVEAARAPEARGERTRLVLLAVALSGLSALGAEVVWTRLLSLLLGGTVYTFAIILAVFLIGLGLGSGTGALLSRHVARPRVALGWCQLLLAAGIAWTAWQIACSLPYWPVNPSLSASPWFTFQIDLARCLWAMLPPACLWGASFPLALAAAAPSGKDTGKVVGAVYAANTLGAIVGALGFSLLVIPSLGTQKAERILIGIAAVASIAMLASCARAAGARERAVAVGGAAVSVAFAALLAGLLAWSVAPLPPGVVGYGRFFPTYTSMPKFLYVGEGMSSSVAVSEEFYGVRSFHVSGKVEASTEPQDMRLQKMLANLPALFHPAPRSVLIVGFGAGVTAGSFVPYPEVERIVICEIEPLIPRVVSQYFREENNDVLSDPRVEVVYDDARHYLLTSREKFDIITSDPIHPWVKGAATLYTREYFDLVKRHLNPGGLVTQWVPLYESDTNVVKSEMATFFGAFPGGTVWANLSNGEGYDTVLLGQPDGALVDLDNIQDRVASKDYAWIVELLSEAGFASPLDLLSTYAGQARDLAPWLKGAEINRDRNLRLQYLAGLGLNRYEGGAIYREIQTYRKLPDGFFVQNGMSEEALAKLLGFGASDSR